MSTEYRGANRVLRAIPTEDFSRLFSNLEPVDLSLRHIIQDVSQPVDHVCFMESGIASILKIMTDGSTIEVGMTGAEGMTGVASVLDHEAAATHAIVQIPGTALRMPLARCQHAFAESADVRRPILRFAASHLALGAQTAACNRLHTIEQRCARWLLMAYDRVKSGTMPMTHEFLASMLGVQRAGVTVAAGELQRSGLISYRQGSVTIRDPEGLKAFACECYGIDHDRLNHLF